MINKEDLTVRPLMNRVDVDKIPQELKDIPQWVNWEWQINGKKWSKPPVHPSGIRTDHAQSNLTFDECYQNTLLNPSLGMGISLRNTDRLCGLDYDGVISKEGLPLPEFHEELSNLPDTYVEISPSGTGVRVFGYGDIRNIGGRKGSHYEQYSTGRYLTVTGNANGQGGKPLIDLTQFTQNRGNERSDVSTVKEYVGNTSTIQTFKGNPKIDYIIDNLSLLPSEAYKDWLDIGMILHYESGGSEEALNEWDEWSEGDPSWEPGKCREKWASFGKTDKDPITVKSFGQIIAPYKHIMEMSTTHQQRIDVGELLKTKPKDREFVCHPLFLTSSFNMIHAKRGLGKTNFSMSLSICLAEGLPFLKWTIDKKHKVLYVDGELSLNAVHSQLARCAAACDTTVSPGHLHLITPDKLPDKHVKNLSKLENQMWMNKHIYEINPEVVVFDSLSTCFFGQTESQEAWENVQLWMTKLRSEGRCVILVHHDNKSGLAQSGFANKEVTMDEVIHLTPSPAHDDKDGMMMHLEFSKHRNLHGNEIEEFECGFKKEGTMRVDRWTWTKENISLDERVAEMYKEKISLRNIALDLGLKGHSTVQSMVNRMIKAGTLVKN